MLSALARGLETTAELIERGVMDQNSAKLRQAWFGFLRLVLQNVVVVQPDALKYASSLLSNRLTEASTRETSSECRYYLGALWSLKKVLDGVVARVPSEDALRILRGRKHAERVLHVLSERGICRATELSRLVGIHRDQVVEVTKPLEEAGLLLVEQEGKYRFYSLTGEGLLLTRHLSRVVAAGMPREQSESGSWCNVEDLVSSRPTEKSRKLGRQALISLQEDAHEGYIAIRA